VLCGAVLQVVTTMVEMDFLHAHTRYPQYSRQLAVARR
jgi:hypothetical protein